MSRPRNCSELRADAIRGPVHRVRRPTGARATAPRAPCSDCRDPGVLRRQAISSPDGSRGWPFGPGPVLRSPSDESAPGEAHPAATADDQMVEDLDAEETSGLGETSGDALVIT